MARGLKFQMLEVEGLYYLCSKDKGADQLRDYPTADLHDYHAAELRLCFGIYTKQVYSWCSSYEINT